MTVVNEAWLDQVVEAHQSWFSASAALYQAKSLVDRYSNEDVNDFIDDEDIRQQLTRDGSWFRLVALRARLSELKDDLTLVERHGDDPALTLKSLRDMNRAIRVTHDNTLALVGVP